MWKYSQILVLLTLVACSAANNQYTEFYESLDEHLKEPFLKYQLAEGILADIGKITYKSTSSIEDIKTAESLGIEEEIFEFLQSLGVPEGFAEHLYALIKEKFQLTRSQMVDLARTRSGGGGWELCLESTGECYDIGDVGSNCC